jgi:hypothetical protein
MKSVLRSLVVLVSLWLLVAVNMHAQNEPRIGMEKTEVLRRFSEHVFSESPTGGVTLRISFYGHQADVYVGFDKEGRVFMVDASFSADHNQRDLLNLFRDVRRQLERLSGREYSYARIDGIDVLGESGGWITDKNKTNAFIFGTMRDGLVYQVEIFAEKIGDMAKAGEVRLTIDKEGSVKPPTSK